MTRFVKKNYIYIAITIGVVLIWRGIWGLADLYLFKENPVLSFVASIILGIIVLLVIDFEKGDISELNYASDD